MCPDCEHTAHAGRCFHTEKVDGRYVTCHCKRRASPTGRLHAFEPPPLRNLPYPWEDMTDPDYYDRHPS